MSNEHNSEDQPMVYQIRLKGRLGDRWADWFEGLTLTLEANGDTVLTGSVADQAALFGLLRKVRDLGMPLLSVMRVEPGPSTTLSQPSGLEKPRPPTHRGPTALGGTGQTTASDVKP